MSKKNIFTLLLDAAWYGEKFLCSSGTGDTSTSLHLCGVFVVFVFLLKQVLAHLAPKVFLC